MKESEPKMDTQGAIKEDSLAKEITNRYKIADTHYEKWNKEAKEDFNFALGNQWTQEELDVLKEQSRPALTFNRIRSIINLISGYQRENAARIKVNPEGGEDRIFSEVMDRAIKAIDKWSHLSYKLGYLFDDGCYCGKGYLEAIISYEKDPIRGEIQFKQRSPYQILPDPECLEYDLNEGAGYCFKRVRLTKEKIIELYPKKKKLIEGFVTDNDDRVENGDGWEPDEENQDDDYGNDPTNASTQTISGAGTDQGPEKDGKFTIKEYWRPKMVEKFFVINKNDNQPDRFDTKEEAEAFVTKQQFGRVIPRKVPEMWVAAHCCGYILQNEKSPFEPYYSGYPFFRFIADWAPNAENEVLRVQGITRPLKDPQREKNKSKSQYLHITNTQANSGWIGDEDALTPNGWKELQKMGSKPGITIQKKMGKELREIQPKGPNQSHLIREEKADEEFKQISGINPDLMGFQEGTSSGRAISMRIKQAILALVRLFSNYRYTKEIIGKFLLEMMPMLFDGPKLAKVIGPEYMRKAVDLQKYPEGLKDGNIEAFLQMVGDNKYDVFVTESDQNSTIRYEIFQELTELLKAGAPIPVELLVDYMDLPNSEEVKQKIAQAKAEMAAAEAAKSGKPPQ